MNNDFYSEQLVAKAPDGSDWVKRVLIGLGGLAVAIGVFLFLFILMPMNLVLVFGIFYLTFYLMSGIDTEYEYIITNGDIDIDKIIGKRKRKRLMSAKISDFTAFGPYDEAPEAPSGITVVHVTDGSGENIYYADFKHKSAGDVRLIFSPNEKTIDGIVMFMSRQLKTEYNRKKLKK